MAEETLSAREAAPRAQDIEAPEVLHRPKGRRVANRKGALAVCIIASVLLVALIFWGMAVAGDAAATDFSQKNLPPGPEHLFGTDWMGRDMLLRTVAGLSLSLRVGLLAVAVSGAVAVGLGVLSSLGGRGADAVVSWLTDSMMGLPHIVLLILISYALGKGFWGVTAGLALTHWPSLSRVIRAELLQVREAPYVGVARRLGRSFASIARMHLLPAVAPQFFVGLLLILPHAILHEASVTFLGFGLPPEEPAIGIILSESMGYLSAGYWWLAVFPGLALVGAVVLFDQAASSLRKLIDPHSAQE